MYLRGTFSLLSPATLLQALCQEQRTVQIAARRGPTVARLWILEGLVVAAACADLHGPEAVYQLAGWDTGEFVVTPLPGDPPATMAATCDELLLEAARRRDERR